MPRSLFILAISLIRDILGIHLQKKFDSQNSQEIDFRYFVNAFVITDLSREET